MSGKGDKPRPKSVSPEEFGRRWDNIFRKKDGYLPDAKGFFRVSDYGNWYSMVIPIEFEGEQGRDKSYFEPKYAVKYERLETYNGNNIIFGLVEAFEQSDIVPEWYSRENAIFSFGYNRELI